MAISDSFNLARALDSQAYAYKCWYNYQYGNNTMGISSKDINEIRQAWSSELANWQATALDDENAYEIEDDDFSRACKDGKDQGKEVSGDVNKAGMVTRGVTDAAAGAVGALATTIGGQVANKVAGKVVNKIAGDVVGDAATKAATKAAINTVTDKAAKKAAKEAVKGAVKQSGLEAGKKAATEAAGEAGEKAAEAAGEKVTGAGENISWIITAPLACATGVRYMANKPNKDEKEACDALQDEMLNAQAATTSAQELMAESRSAVEDLTSEAEDAKDMVEEENDPEMAEVELYKASYDAIVARAASRGGLTEEEKAEAAFYQAEIQGIVGEDGTIETRAAEASELVGDIYDDMGTYQDVFDDSAETVAEVQGLTDFAESFDSATQTMCYVEAAGQTLNAFAGGKAALQAGKFAASGGIFTAWAWGFAAMGAAGAATSGVGAYEQMSWAGEVGNEIEMREVAQELNSATSDIYDESIQDYEGAMTSVEDMTVAIPESIEELELPEYVVDEGEGGPALPTVTTTAATTGATAGATTGTTSTRSASTDPTNTDDKKDDKKR